MEVGVRLIGIILRILCLLLAPCFWLLAKRKNYSVPATNNPILLYGVQMLAEKIRSGVLTSEEIVQAYIERINEVNPLINAVVEERFQEALEEAKAADRTLTEVRRNQSWSIVQDKPLFGVPFTVKESCSLKGLSNSVGCLDNASSKALRDGGAVRAVRRAGGIPLLVSNTPEMCLGWETSNLLHGVTNNPYCLSRTPGGSSGGEAALVSSCASPWGLVSDIAGSIRLPAAFCHLAAIKPTPGIVSTEGHLPALRDQNYPKYLALGPMARSAQDLPLLLTVLAADNAPLLRLDQPVDLKKLNVHYMTEATKSIALIPTHTKIKEAIMNAAKYLQRECGSKINEKKFKNLDDSVEISISVFFEMKDIPNMLQDPTNPKRNRNMLIELVKLMFGSGALSLQGLGFSWINKTKLFISKNKREYYNEQAKKLREELVETLGENGVLLYPVFSGPAHRHNEIFVRAAGVLYTMPFNILGFPAAVVPMGLYNGLPIAIQVISAPYQDRLCLAVAKQLEIGFGGWQPPF